MSNLGVFQQSRVRTPSYIVLRPITQNVDVPLNVATVFLKANMAAVTVPHGTEMWRSVPR